MASAFREAVFHRLRPHLHIRGSTPHRFYFAPKPDRPPSLLPSLSSYPEAYWTWASSWKLDGPWEPGVEVCISHPLCWGDMVELTVEVLLRHVWLFPPSGAHRLRFQRQRPQPGQDGWAVLLDRHLSSYTLDELSPRATPGPVVSWLTLIDDQDAQIVVAETAGLATYFAWMAPGWWPRRQDGIARLPHRWQAARGCVDDG